MAGGKRKDVHYGKHNLRIVRGPADKVPTVSVDDLDRDQFAAAVVRNADSSSPQGCIRENAKEGVTVYTDEARIDGPLKHQYNHQAVKHSVGEHDRDQAYTNGIESFPGC